MDSLSPLSVQINKFTDQITDISLSLILHRAVSILVLRPDTCKHNNNNKAGESLVAYRRDSDDIHKGMLSQDRVAIRNLQVYNTPE